jgi:hypothetical protein
MPSGTLVSFASEVAWQAYTDRAGGFFVVPLRQQCRDGFLQLSAKFWTMSAHLLSTAIIRLELQTIAIRSPLAICRRIAMLVWVNRVIHVVTR